MRTADTAVLREPGIAPDSLAVLTSGDVWVPLTIDIGRENRLNHVITVVGRLKPGVKMEQAQAEMDTVSHRVGQQYPEVKDWGIRLVSFYRTFVSDQLQTALLVLLGAVAVVLLIACANVANLLLSRAAGRQKEIAVRIALGAGAGRLLRQLLTESVVLSAAGGGAGLLAAVWAVRLMNRPVVTSLLPVPALQIDTAVLLFALGTTLATGLLFGLAPAWQASRTDLNKVLKQGGREAASGARPRLRQALVAAELALATMLLIGAGMLLRSLLRLEQVRLGFQPERLLTFQLSLPPAKYPPGPKTTGFYRDLAASLDTLPGVRGAAASSGIPFGNGNYTTTPMLPLGKTVLPPETPVPLDWRTVTHGNSVATRPLFQRSGPGGRAAGHDRQPGDSDEVLGIGRSAGTDDSQRGGEAGIYRGGRSGRRAQHGVEPRAGAGGVPVGRGARASGDGRGGAHRRQTGSRPGRRAPESA